MPVLVGSVNNIDINIDYMVSPEHRPGGNHTKSKWTITPAEEIECFRECFKNKWISDKNGWGLVIHPSKGNFSLLGRSSNMLDLYLAKFVNASPWHGYPANIKENIHDRPGHQILMSWYDKELIHKHQVSRIKTGRI